MKSFLMACAAAIIIAIVGVVVLNGVQQPADKAYTSTSVRLGA
jgi:hypothetical protein